MPKTKNSSRILRTIWQYPESSRAEVASHLGLDKSTVTLEVDSLLEQGAISELPQGPSGKYGGRKPIPLIINKDYGYIIGIAVQSGHYSAVAVNLAGEILEIKEEDESITRENLAPSIQAIYWELKSRLSKYPGTILGVGLGAGGLINPNDGTVEFSVPLKVWEPLNVVETLSKKLNVPFFIENNANCCAWSELAFHKNIELRNILFALIEFRQALVPHAEYGGVGIGFGLVLNGKVHYGSNYFAGEFRSVLCTENNGIQVSCPKEDLSQILKDPSVLEKFVTELARNIAMLVNTLDCDSVFIGGDIEDSELDFCRILEKAIQDNWMYPVKRQIKIQYSSMGTEAVAFGAAGMLLNRLFATNQVPICPRE